MDAIRIERAQATRPAEGRNGSMPAADATATEIRVLDDWELALASGGDDTPEWP
jgi:hypothetical protein